MRIHRWPDELQSPEPTHVYSLCNDFWRTLHRLPDLIHRDEHLLAEACTAELRGIVVEMMLALNGIRWPDGTAHLNGYLGASQRRVLEQTLVTDSVARQSWIARAVALTVIYRWYAPQLTAHFGFEYPHALENEVWTDLLAALPDWPQTVTTE
ncbi:MAG: hypothetical protein HC802_22140 [Caldilineaceae bacterium]|nr:hypothetical protein [Caldilineaceae bacterium]